MKLLNHSFFLKPTLISIITFLSCTVYQVKSAEVRGNVSGVWSIVESPYIVTADISIASGDSLTIEPGVKVLFASSSADFFVEGTLMAIGTPASPITFTTINDTPAPNSWGRIFFRNNENQSVARLEHCDISYGGGFNGEMIRIEKNTVEIGNSRVTHCGSIGINIIGKNPVIQNCRFESNLSYAMAMTPDASPMVGGNQATDNGANVIGIHGGTISSVVQWRRDSIPYRIINDVTISSEGQLTIEPGILVEFQDASDDLWVDGVLIAEGTASNRIVFTSDETDKLPSQWGHIGVRANSDDALTRFSYCDFEYGGGFQNELLSLQASPSVQHCRFTGSRDRGLTLIGSSSRVAFNEFKSNAGYAVFMDLNSFPKFERNSAESNGGNSIGVSGGTFQFSGTWVRDEIPYTLVSDTHLAEALSLSIDPGTIIQFQNSSDDLVIDGMLVAKGTETLPIVFTSNEIEKSPSQWGQIRIRPATDNQQSSLIHCRFEYGGGFQEGMLRI